jgi:hypothetical protein
VFIELPLPAIPPQTIALRRPGYDRCSPVRARHHTSVLRGVQAIVSAR